MATKHADAAANDTTAALPNPVIISDIPVSPHRLGRVFRMMRTDGGGVNQSSPAG
jgi:hypothetical protein